MFSVVIHAVYCFVFNGKIVALAHLTSHNLWITLCLDMKQNKDELKDFRAVVTCALCCVSGLFAPYFPYANSRIK